jgi:hypothetical protein
MVKFIKHAAILAHAGRPTLVQQGPHCRFNHYYPYRFTVIGNMILLKPIFVTLAQQRTEMKVSSLGHRVGTIAGSLHFLYKITLSHQTRTCWI